MGGATSPLPAPPSRNRTKHPNQAIRKNSTIPQSKFPLFLGCHPGSSKPRPTGRGNVPVAHSYPKSNYLKNTTITSVDFHSSKGPSPEVPQRMTKDNPTFSELKRSSRADSTETCSRQGADSTIVFAETADAAANSGEAANAATPNARQFLQIISTSPVLQFADGTALPAQCLQRCLQL